MIEMHVELLPGTTKTEAIEDLRRLGGKLGVTVVSNHIGEMLSSNTVLEEYIEEGAFANWFSEKGFIIFQEDSAVTHVLKGKVKEAYMAGRASCLT